jgi:pentafunctional AROM polypeptide
MVDINEVISVVNQETFGGASVTIPLKLDVISLLDSLSPAAAAIGAVNTIICCHAGVQRILHGDNTDWIGIMRSIQRRVKNHTAPIALVIGAGGTAMAASYAMQQLGAKLFIFNRTYSKAEEVAQRFNGTAISSISSLPHIDIIIGTIPASAQTNFPHELFKSCPIVLDAAYKPAETPLLMAAREAGCSCIQGAEMLYEQALEQFRLWTNRVVPPSIMSNIAFTMANT